MTNLSTEKYFSFQDVLFHYREWHVEASTSQVVHEKPLVFLHGFAQSSESWDEIVFHFPLRVAYALDWVGHGKTTRASISTTKSPGYDFRDELLSCHHQLSFQAQALLSFLEFVHNFHQEKLEVVAYSMGGRIALAALNESPERFSRCVGNLVLESAGIGLPDETTQKRRAALNQKRANDLRALGLESFMDEWEKLPLFESQRRFSWERRAELREGRMNNSAEALARSLENAGAHAMPLQNEIYKSVKQAQFQASRFHYFAGEWDEKYAHIAQDLGKARIMSAKVCSQVGHNIHWESPSLFVEELFRALVVCSSERQRF